MAGRRNQISFIELGWGEMNKAEKKKPGPKGPHGRPLKKMASLRFYEADVEAIKAKTGLSMQRWIDGKIAEEKGKS